MGVLQKIQTSTLLQIAGGTFLIGATALYMAQRNLQDRVRSLPHYNQAFQIIGSHEGVKRLLGPPIAIGKVDLADRRHNYVSENESKVSSLSFPFLNFFTPRLVLIAL